MVVLGIYDRCTPKLASDASRAVAMLSSLAEAQAQLRSDGIALDIKTLRSTAYRYAARARAAQQSAACGLLDRVTGKRVVVSLDGGRVRVRRKKSGPKTKKGRNRFHTDWKEPKLLILYVVGDDGRPSQTWAPIIDGTLRGPEAVFALLLSYARQIGLNAADKVLFIADGAPWIWRRLQRLIAALGLSLSSLAEAQAQLRSDGIALDIKTLRSTAYRYAARARAAQRSAACGLLDRVTGKRVVVSLDGGRVRVRRKKSGPKTKKGRNRFHTDWKEPKLLILYVVGDDGRPSQTWAPIIDGTLRGPEAVFALLLSYARQIGLNAADKVLFIADGAPWIWRRLQRLIAALGLSPTQVLGLIDFYHAAKQLSDAVKLRRWSATQRTRWLNRTRGLLKRARVDEVITALRELCRGRTAGKIRTHLNCFLKNRHRFAYTTMVGLGLPRGSGAVESAIRRVINLRIKGASIYWLPESVDAILLLRSFYKSGRWNCLQRMAMTPVGVSA